ncbi:MAG: hypothetical protein F4W92_08500 [Gammaproteobacteria bacterium]|nr:hypothetical protein [Gammaproteobacteria bacterium]
MNKFSCGLIVVACVTCVSGCVVLLPSPTVTDHADNHVLIATQKHSDLTSRWGMIKICREFYRHYEDAFDVLIFVYFNHDGNLEHWGTNVVGRMLTVRNAERGTGERVFDHGRTVGSESRLRGVVQLSSANQIFDGALLHELMHLWVSSNREVIPTMYRGHWGFSSVAGQLGGFQPDKLLDLGDGKYSAGDFEPQKADGTIPYSKLEMYLAGWIPPTEVPDIWVAEDGAWMYRELTPEVRAECEIKDGPFAGELDHDCLVQTDSTGNKIFTASEISIWNIEQVVEKLGPRKPDYEHSQKEFRVAFVFVTDSENTISRRELDRTKSYIEEFTARRPITEKLEFTDSETTERLYIYNFWEASSGIATLEADDLQAYRR